MIVDYCSTDGVFPARWKEARVWYSSLHTAVMQSGVLLETMVSSGLLNIESRRVIPGNSASEEIVSP